MKQSLWILLAINIGIIVLVEILARVARSLPGAPQGEIAGIKVVIMVLLGVLNLFATKKVVGVQRGAEALLREAAGKPVTAEFLPTGTFRSMGALRIMTQHGGVDFYLVVSPDGEVRCAVEPADEDGPFSHFTVSENEDKDARHVIRASIDPAAEAEMGRSTKMN